MTWITIALPMVIAACVTIAAVYLRAGSRQPRRVAYLLFAANALVMAVCSVVQLALIRAESPAQYLALLRWLDITGWMLIVTLSAFVWVFFGTGRKWLAFLGPAVSGLSLIADLGPDPKLVYRFLTGLKKVATFGGATFTVPEAVPSPWDLLFYVGVLLLLLFVADASISLWRRGARRRAALVGGTIILFVLVSGVQAALVENGFLRMPYVVSFAYLAVLIAMGMELGDEVLHAIQLARDLHANEQRLVLASKATQDLAGRLIGAHEEERMRLAGELHDGLSQNLALLAVELEMVGQKPPDAPGEVKERMEELSGQVKALSTEVHRLSHTLHPAKLEQLGLAAATTGFCREISQAHRIVVQSECRDVPRWLAPEVALCLYRVTQEALQNIIKHSGAKSATVEITAAKSEIRLNIADDGKGFDAADSPNANGLGLSSMRERVRLVQGEIHWQSQPGQGTRVFVRVPLPTEGTTG